MTHGETGYGLCGVAQVFASTWQGIIPAGLAPA